jgi:hypothetical protein
MQIARDPTGVDRDDSGVGRYLVDETRNVFAA